MKLQGICDGCRTPGDLPTMNGQSFSGIPAGWTLVQMSGTTGTTETAYCPVCAPKIKLPTPPVTP